MRLHSLHILKTSIREATPTTFELIDMLKDDVILLKKGSNRQTHYSKEAFESSFIPVPASKDD